MRLPITTHLPDRSPEEDAEAWIDVEATLETAGWRELEASIEARCDQLLKRLVDQGPHETAAEYASIAGEMRGLRSIEGIIKGLQARAEEANP